MPFSINAFSVAILEASGGFASAEALHMHCISFLLHLTFLVASAAPMSLPFCLIAAAVPKPLRPRGTRSTDGTRKRVPRAIRKCFIHDAPKVTEDRSPNTRTYRTDAKVSSR